MEKFDKRVNKKTGEELQQFLAFRKKGGKIPSKKGKGSYNRNSFKKGSDYFFRFIFKNVLTKYKK